MSEKYWQEMFERQAYPRVPCVDDLFELSQHDAVVKAFMKQWTTGACTFEQAMVGLVRELSGQLRRYSEHELWRLRTEVPAPITITPPKS